MNKTLILSLVCLAGCGSMQDMLNNMGETNSKLEESIVLFTDVGQTARENQVQVERSTREIGRLADINDQNAEVIKKTMSITVPSTIPKLAALGLLLLLLVPSFILAFSYFSLRRRK